MGHKARPSRDVFINVRPAQDNDAWCRDWWPRDQSGAYRWVTLNADAQGWTTNPDGDCRIRNTPEEIEDVQTFYHDNLKSAHTPDMVEFKIVPARRK